MNWFINPTHFLGWCLFYSQHSGVFVGLLLTLSRLCKYHNWRGPLWDYATTWETSWPNYHWIGFRGSLKRKKMVLTWFDHFCFWRYGGGPVVSPVTFVSGMLIKAAPRRTSQNLFGNVRGKVWIQMVCWLSDISTFCFTAAYAMVTYCNVTMGTI